MTRAGRLFVLPLVLLALVLQAGAAIAATRAQADAAGDPFAAAPICSPNAAKTSGGQPAPGGEHGDHHCPICLTGAVAHAVPLVETPSLVRPGVLCAEVPSLARHVQPRGPPARAPKARGPPTFA